MIIKKNTITYCDQNQSNTALRWFSLCYCFYYSVPTSFLAPALACEKAISYSIIAFQNLNINETIIKIVIEGREVSLEMHYSPVRSSFCFNGFLSHQQEIHRNPAIN